MDKDLEKDLARIARIDAVQKILEVVCRTTGMGFSAVARVTESRWIACAVRDEISFGLKRGGELELETTICNEIRQSGREVVIDHVALDENFRGHPTPKKYGFQSYISVPINLRTGQFFGTLCAIDPRPARVNTPEIIGMFKLFADLIAMHLDAQERIAASETALLNERQTALLRDQFIAVLGHDLRNPLGAIHSGAQLLAMMDSGEDTSEVVEMIERSATRMAGLIENILDFARGRLGGGLAMSRTVEGGLEETISHVVAELKTAWPQREIQQEISITQPVLCNLSRIAQMLSNLLANALAHGDPNSAVQVHARTSDDILEISVINRGETIPPEVIEQLFEPFVRGTVKPGQQGLGLGLYIAAEIARAHQGSLRADSSGGQTRFTFQMPIEKKT